jgi:hypothetical protein
MADPVEIAADVGASNGVLVNYEKRAHAACQLSVFIIVENAGTSPKFRAGALVASDIRRYDLWQLPEWTQGGFPTTKTVLQKLKEISIFADVSDADLSHIAEIVQQRDYPEGAVII